MQHKNNNEISIADLNQALIREGVEVVVNYLVKDGYNVSGDYLTMGSYMGGTGNSFVVDVQGKRPGMWFENNPDQAPNGKTQGDLVDLWMLTGNISKAEAIKQIKKWLSIKRSNTELS